MSKMVSSVVNRSKVVLMTPWGNACNRMLKENMIQHYTYNTVTIMLKGNINLYLGKEDCKEMCENVNNG